MNFRKASIGAVAAIATIAATAVTSVPASAGEPLFTNGIRLFGAKAPKPGATMGIGCPVTAVFTGAVSDRRHAVVNGVQGGAVCIAAVSAGAMLGGPAGAVVGGLIAGVVAPAIAAGQKRRLQQ